MDTTTRRLHLLRDALAGRGLRVDGPHTGRPSPAWDYLNVHLPGGRKRHVHVVPDGNGCWQAQIYEGKKLVRMADGDGRDWPGDWV